MIVVYAVWSRLDLRGQRRLRLLQPGQADRFISATKAKRPKVADSVLARGGEMGGDTFRDQKLRLQSVALGQNSRGCIEGVTMKNHLGADLADFGGYDGPRMKSGFKGGHSSVFFEVVIMPRLDLGFEKEEAF